MSARVLVLMGNSLFAKGVFNRLRLYLEESELHIVDPCLPDALQQVIDAHPSVLILDEGDPQVLKNFSLDILMASVPDLKLIRLNPRSPHIQVIHWEKQLISDTHDLIGIIGQANGMPNEPSASSGNLAFSPISDGG